MWLVCGTVPIADFPLTLATWDYNPHTHSLTAQNQPSQPSQARLSTPSACPSQPDQARLSTPSACPSQPNQARLLAPSACPSQPDQTDQLPSLPVLPVNRGTPALIAALTITCQTLQIPPPQALLVGDTGSGEGSAQLYTHLSKILPQHSWQGITFHYLFPDVDGHNHVLMALNTLEDQGKKPILVADAGFMYVAKMSGYADSYDLFTPDLGEMAFLADEKAPHPFYTRGFLLAEEDDIPKLITLAQAHNNSPKNLIIKGKTDYIVHNHQIIAKVNSPHIPYMEPIGGTGDLVTGLVSGYLAASASNSPSAMPLACWRAACTNRILGSLANPTPATQVAELLNYLPQAIAQALKLEPDF